MAEEKIETMENKDKKENEEKAVWNSYSEAEKEALASLNENYKDFRSNCKTERESTGEIIRQAREKGYRDLQEIIEGGESLKQGDKVYAVCMKKAVALFNIGTMSME